MKMISFIFSLSSDVFRPLLIISTPAALHSWDDKLFNLAPSVDVVVYNGSKEIRESIRKLEFSEEGDSVMFQVLITLPEVLSEVKCQNLYTCVYWSFCLRVNSLCVIWVFKFEQFEVP